MANGIVYPLATRGTIHGGPYEPGTTHSKAFNVRGHSDNWQSENAVDIYVPKGTPVYAVADGKIGSRIGSLGHGGRFAGLRVYVDTATNSFYYQHLSKIIVHAGQTVHAGEIIGYSGEANGVQHLHFASQHLNPENLIKGAPVPDGSAPISGTPPGQTDASSSGPQPIPAAPAGPGLPVSGDQTPISPPGSPPLPTDLPVPGVNVAMPGSVSFAPHSLAALWQSVAQDDFVSPDTQRLITNSQLAAGG